MNSIVFFGGSKIEEQSVGEINAFLDQLLPEVKSNVDSVIYGGGTYGVMGIVKDRVEHHGINLHHYIMEKYKRTTDPKTSQYFKDDNDRIKAFYESGTHFVGLPGGIGTVTELLTIGNFIRASKDSKQIFIPEFFKAFYQFIETLEKSGMLADVDVDIFNRVSSHKQIVNRIRV